MKTSQLKNIFLLLFLTPSAFAFNEFECLRDMLSVTAHGAFQAGRKGVETPFMLDGKHIVFPEVSRKKVTGFYLYRQDGAWYFDSAEVGERSEAIAELEQAKLYRLVAQPTGLETVTVYFKPGYKAYVTNREGPVILGVSILPVIAAFVSRPEREELVYQNPMLNLRSPAADSMIAKMSVRNRKAGTELMAPMRSELKLRESWASGRNLDDNTFKKLASIQRTTCKR